MKEMSSGSSEELAAKEVMERAIENYMSIAHGTTIMLEAYILQAMGQSAEEDRPLLNYTGKTGQNGVVTAGLGAYISDNIQDALFLNQGDD